MLLSKYLIVFKQILTTIFAIVKKKFLLIIGLCAFITQVVAQCSICTKTASQLGDGPAQGLNGAIIYLMITPLAIMGFIGYRWWKREKMQ